MGKQYISCGQCGVYSQYDGIWNLCSPVAGQVGFLTLQCKTDGSSRQSWGRYRQRAQIEFYPMFHLFDARRLASKDVDVPPVSSYNPC